ncbi:MAG: hypothetical protein AAF580_09340 [Pseudomonadota bacterium]
MTKPSLLIISVGQLGTNILEAVARANLFDRIVIAGRDGRLAQERANGAMVGAGLEGAYPDIKAAELDVGAPSFVNDIRRLSPDFVLTTASLMPWWKVGESRAPKLPFGGYVSLHLSLARLFRDRLADADLGAKWINASYPDVVNPILGKTGCGPLCGIGNVQEPLPKIIHGLCSELNVPPSDVRVRLVAQHAFEYYVFSEDTGGNPPPHLLYAEVNGEDKTALAEEILFRPFAFRYDLFFNRVTASAAVEALAALTSDKPSFVHMPGVLGLVGGYPVTVDGGAVRLDLHDDWTEADAHDVNRRSLRWEGIETIENDGTILFTEEAQIAFRALVGRPIEGLRLDDAQDHANRILAAL